MKHFVDIDRFKNEATHWPKHKQALQLMSITTNKKSVPSRLSWSRVVLASFGLFIAVGVQAADFTWVGGGANESILTAGNWEGGIAPPTDNTANLIFSTGGTNCLNDSSGKRFAKVTFNADGDFSVTRPNTTANFSYLPGGIYAGIPGATPHTYTIACNVYFNTNDGVITITNNGVPGGTTVEFKNQIISDGTHGFTVYGDGRMIWSSTNGNGAVGPIRYDGTGTLILHQDSTSTGQLIGGKGLVAGGGGLVRFEGTGTNLVYDGGGGRISVTNGSTLDLNGHTEKFLELPIAGAGIGGAGALINSSATPAATIGTLNCLASATVGGTGNITINGAVAGNSSALTKVGNNILTLTGTNTYSGPTLIRGGTLALSGNAILGGTPAIDVANGSTFDVTGLNSQPYVLGASQTLSNSTSSTGIIKGNVNASAGLIGISYTDGNAALAVVDGTLSIGSSTKVSVNNIGSQLAAGMYTLIAKSAGGTVGGTVPSTVTVGGAGTVGAATLQISDGELAMVVTSTPPSLTNLVAMVSDGQLVLNWPSGQGWYLQVQTNPPSIGLSSNWVDVLGATPPLTNSINLTNQAVFYRLATAPLSTNAIYPMNVPDLVAFWDFQENGGDRVDKSANHFYLVEANGPVARVQVNGAPFGPYGAYFTNKCYFKVPRAQLGALDIHGTNQVTVVAWIKRATAAMNFLAGIWDESRSKRQFGLFINVNWNTQLPVGVTLYNRVSGHVSQYGGPTPGYPYCYEVSIGDTGVAQNGSTWACVALTYDRQFIRSYYNGHFDGANPNPDTPYDMANPYYLPLGIFDGGTDGADFTVGANSVSGSPNNAFIGVIGGVAVYNRALTEQELLQLAKPVLP